ncbi:MAG TPA: FtsX-like permease family protein, partial [Rhodanobacteraceae bacterium]|nr:FtsX-like permease family protein [Rhodanobacteraceae bacterium]
MKPLVFAARSLRREFRHGELATLAAALVLAVAALAAVGTLADRVERAIVASAAELIGGDLGIASRRAIPPGFADEAHALDLATTRLADFPSVVFAGDASQFCDIRASDTAFPLRGVLSVRDAGGVERVAHAPAPGAIYADHRALVALGVPIGASVQVGGRDLRVAGEIAQTPDGSGLIRLAPRVLMNIADAEQSGLLGVGSRARHRLLVAGDADAVARFAAWTEPRLPGNARLVTVEDARQNLRRAFDRGESFLRLAALLAALLSGIAVALSAQRFARRKVEDVALLRCLGASRREILFALTLELGLLAIAACTLGLALGLAMQQGVFVLARGLLPGAAPGIPLAPGLAAWAIGAAVLFGFALPPLLRLREVEPMRIFRRDAETRLRRFDALYLLPFALAAVLIWLEADSTRLAGTLIVSLGGVALAALAFGLALLAGVRALGRRLSGAWRFGLANLTRRRALSLVQIGALALGLTALDVLAVIGPSLLDRWRLDLPADTPNWFLLNVQPDQNDAMRRRLSHMGADNVDVLPLAVGQLTAINGHAPRPSDDDEGRDDNRSDDDRRGREVRLSWSATLPASNALREGRWFDPAETAPAVSVDMRWVERYGLELGDRVSLRVGERDIDARVTSIRGVDWDSFRVNFFVMIDPVTGATLPHSHIASFHLPAGSSASLAALTRDFPNVSLIDVNSILERVRGIIDRVGHAVTWVLGFSLAAGVLVLLAALAATADERRFEIALLRTLGAHRRQLSAAVLGEFIALGALAGIIGALGAAATGLALADRVFRLDGYAPPWA